MRSKLQIVLLPMLMLGLVGIGFGQNPAPGTAANAIPAGSAPGYARVAPVAVNSVQPGQLQPVTSATILDFPSTGDSSRAAFTAPNNGAAANAPANGASFSSPARNSSRRNDEDGGGRRPNRSTIDGVDTLATFAGGFITQAGPDTGTFFPFTMIGNHPLAGGTTVIPAQITTVNLRLLNADGSLNVVVPFSFKDLLEDSPNFEEANYRSGRHIQFGDAVHRAQFFHSMGDDWHTVLRPHFVDDVTFTIPQFVNVRFPGNVVRPVQAYILSTSGDGHPVVFMLDLLFNFLFDNQVVNDINAGNFTTNALSMTMLPNTFLFSINGRGQIAGCCVLGFHTFFEDPTAIPQPRWVTLFASWISPGTFGPGFEDVTAFSHEAAESFADPFLDNATSLWQFPNVPATAQICQNNLEEGDPIETLNTETVPIRLREGHEVFTYHPQIIPLLQWFEMGAKSNAIDGAFSFPDETALPHSALPCPQ